MGKDISVRPPGKERFVRLVRNFGEGYTLDGIRRRILEQTRAARPLPEPAPKSKRYRVSGNWQARKKATGSRALYLHYCYLLGVFPRDKPQNRKRLHFLLREDLIKLENITQEARLLAVHHIDTAGQLSSYKNELETRIENLSAQRKTLYRKQRTVTVQSDGEQMEKIKSSISSLSNELCQLRKEVKLCSDIEVRSGVMLEHIQAVRQDEQSQRKGKQEHEQFRRRGGTSR